MPVTVVAGEMFQAYRVAAATLEATINDLLLRDMFLTIRNGMRLRMVVLERVGCGLPYQQPPLQVCTAHACGKRAWLRIGQSPHSRQRRVARTAQGPGC